MSKQDDESKLSLLDETDHRKLPKGLFVVGVDRDGVPHIFTEGFLHKVDVGFNHNESALRKALLNAPMYHDRKTASRYASLMLDDVTPGQLLEGEELKPIAVENVFGLLFKVDDDAYLNTTLVTKGASNSFKAFVAGRIQSQKDTITGFRVTQKTAAEGIKKAEKAIDVWKSYLKPKPAKKARAKAKRKPAKKKRASRPKAASRRRNVRSRRGKGRRR